MKNQENLYRPRESTYSHQTVNYSELESIRTRVFSHNKLSTYCEMDELMLVLYPISHCDAQDSIHKSCNPSFIHVAVIMIVAALHRTLFSNKIPHLIFFFFNNAAKKRKTSAKETKLPDTIRKKLKNRTEAVILVQAWQFCTSVSYYDFPAKSSKQTSMPFKPIQDKHA